MQLTVPQVSAPPFSPHHVLALTFCETSLCQSVASFLHLVLVDPTQDLESSSSSICIWSNYSSLLSNHHWPHWALHVVWEAPVSPSSRLINAVPPWYRKADSFLFFPFYLLWFGFPFTLFSLLPSGCLEHIKKCINNSSEEKKSMFHTWWKFDWALGNFLVLCWLHIDTSVHYASKLKMYNHCYKSVLFLPVRAMLFYFSQLTARVLFYFFL